MVKVHQGIWSRIETLNTKPSYVGLVLCMKFQQPIDFTKIYWIWIPNEFLAQKQVLFESSLML